jgi:hypothetical protein
VVSEPIDTETTGWHVIPPGHYVVAEPGEPVRVADLRVAVPVAA